ncbi:ribosome production factor 2 homolog [Agrilus planipennis]|uniref:Ribosome production factor 2 homolog n=1 Tax=Agrilus planipennis TaxID=224129 RepID=A0A1W4X6Z3_AGRPL|nr:ribosome production factor 2 homolog [Agrilus planipennis]
MSVIKRVVKATTRKGKKVLTSREPQLVEGPKRAAFFWGRKTSELVRNLLKDLYVLKKPDAIFLNKKNNITVFENVTPVEAICKKYETPLFAMGSHSKKRPNNVVFGRMFNYSLLDMVELGIDTYEGLKDFAGAKVTLGVKPCLIFNGPWDQSDELKQLKSIFVDLFHKEHVEQLSLQGLEHAISFTVTPEGKIAVRSYKVLLKKSGLRTPRIELEEIGPRFDMSLRRSKLPSEDLMKQACKKPKELKVIKKKNIDKDALGNTKGRIHIGKQEIYKIQTRKMKGLKKTAREKKMEQLLKQQEKSTTNNVQKTKKMRIEIVE